MKLLDREPQEAGTALSPNILLAVNSKYTLEQRRAIGLGESHRIDYLALQEFLGADLIDHNSGPSGFIRELEQRARHDLSLAWQARRLADLRASELKGSSIVVACSSERVGVPLSLLPLNPKVKISVQYHNPLSRIRRTMDNFTGSRERMDQIITLTEAERNILMDSYKLGNVVVLHQPVDTNFYHPLEDVETEDVVVMSGVSKRDYPTFNRAMASLGNTYQARIYPTTHFDPIRVDLGDVPTNVKVDTYSGAKDIRAKVQKARVVVVAIREDSTLLCAGSASINQALAQGKPVIVAADQSEYFQDGINGFLVPPNQPQALAERIKYLLDNPDIADKMGRSGRAFVEENRTIEQWTQKYANHLKSIS